MNRQELKLLLRVLEPYHFAMGTTKLYTYIISLAPKSKRSGKNGKKYVLNKISHRGLATKCIFFNDYWEVLHQLACKNMAICRISSLGLHQQPPDLKTSERISEYLIH